ncbi:MAG: histidine phosphatase family protein [Chlamydiia bacterium]
MSKIKELWLVRHGITEWSKTGRHTSFSDPDLLEEGITKLHTLHRFFEGETFDHVYSSTSLRSRHTAKLLGFNSCKFTEALNEWNYGDYEGLTTPQIRSREHHDWTVFKYGCPGGEGVQQVSDRVDQFLEGLEGKCLLFLSGHIGRALIARFLKFPVQAGAHIFLDAGKLSKLGFEHESAAIYGLNLY